MDEITVAELVIKAQQGDTGAFTEIVRRFEVMAHRIAFTMLGDYSLAEDAAQEAFIDAYLSLHNLREPAAFPGWFRRVVFKHAERQLRRDHGEARLLESSFLGDGSPDMLDTLYIRTRVHTALTALNNRQRMLLQLFYIEGYSQQEIVQMMGWSLPTVKKQLFTARSHLRKEMHDMRNVHDASTAEVSTAQRIEFFLALRARDAERVSQLAQQSPMLLGIFTEWAELDQRNYWPLGYTALHYAVGIGDAALTDALLTAGADTNAPSKHNFATPLHVASMQQRGELVPRLLAAGANVGASNYNGQSPLHFAAYRGNERITQALLAANAAPSLKDAGGRTPVDWALHRGHTSVVEQLRQAGGIAAISPDRSFTTPAPDRASAILETGIKLIDLFAPLARGAANALFTPLSGVGKVVVLEQLMDTMLRRYQGRTLFLGVESGQATGADFAIELNEVGLQDAAELFFAPGDDQQRLSEVVAQARDRLNQTHETLLMVDARFAEVAGLQATIEALAANHVTVLWYGEHTAGVEPEHFASAQAVIGFDFWRALNGYWPALDPLRSHSNLITGRQATLVVQAQRLLRRYEDLRIIVERDPRGLDALATDADRTVVTRARKLHAFLAQPFSITELWTNTIGEDVPLAWAIDGLQAVLDGHVDDVDEALLRMIAGTHRKIRS